MLMAKASRVQTAPTITTSEVGGNDREPCSGSAEKAKKAITPPNRRLPRKKRAESNEIPSGRAAGPSWSGLAAKAVGDA
jgi:hypothetical protein